MYKQARFQTENFRSQLYEHLLTPGFRRSIANLFNFYESSPNETRGVACSFGSDFLGSAPRKENCFFCCCPVSVGSVVVVVLFFLLLAWLGLAFGLAFGLENDQNLMKNIQCLNVSHQISALHYIGPAFSWEAPTLNY